jgi:inward rectifier potassium channel
MRRARSRPTHGFVALEALDPTLAAMVQEIRSYAPEDIRFGMRYADAISVAEDGTPALDLTRIGTVEPDTGGEHAEQGWTEREAE